VAQDESEHRHEQQQQGKHRHERAVGERRCEDPAPVVAELLHDGERECQRDVALLEPVNSPHRPLDGVGITTGRTLVLAGRGHLRHRPSDTTVIRPRTRPDPAVAQT